VKKLTRYPPLALLLLRILSHGEADSAFEMIEGSLNARDAKSNNKSFSGVYGDFSMLRSLFFLLPARPQCGFSGTG
jgi:hypothetical protein